jgi:hypothetical protein
MSGELEPYQPQAPMGGNPAHVRLSIDQVGRISEIVAASGLWKTRAKNDQGRWEDRLYTRAECWAIIMAGQSMGVAPIPAMSSFHMIEGRAEMSANLQAYFLQSSTKYEYRRVFEHDDNDNVTGCVVTVFSKLTGEAIGDARFTMKMAQAAGLIREGGNWKKYPGPMLFARAVSDAVAQITPDAVPMRIYAEGEISGQEPALEPQGVSAVEGEGQVSTTKVEAAITEALAGEGEGEEVIPPEDVDIVEPPPRDSDPSAEPPTCEECGGPGFWHKTEPGVYALVHARGCSHYTPPSQVMEDVRKVEPEERFSPQAVETRLRDDVPKLEADEREIIKATVEAEGLPWGYASIVKLIVDAGYSDVHSWLRGEQAKLATGRPQAPPPATGAPEGVTGANTGSQTAAVLSDAQIRLFNAKCGEAGLSEPERKRFIRKYAQVESSRAIAKKDFDELLGVLRDIAEGSAETKKAYLDD